MALLSGAWATNVIWYLSAHPRRFGELRVDIPRISARVLSARLRELESKGLVARRVMPTSPPSVEYELTELGRELLPAIDAIIAVGTKLARILDHEHHGKPRRSPGRPRRHANRAGRRVNSVDTAAASATLPR
jgi:DNA-binding HxlR family transcriptional regulator